MSNVPNQPPLEEASGPSRDMATLIEVIKTEGRAYRGEEQREDRGKKFREWVTIALLAATLIAVFWQVHEMIRVYGPVRDQAEASKKSADAATRSLVQAQRAWVGPLNAALTAEPTVGKPIEATIQYQNTGREPASDFIYDVQALSVAKDEDQNGGAVAMLQTYMNACEGAKDWKGGSVIYPTSNAFGSGYSLSIKSKDDFVDEAMTKGDKLVIVQGCFLYRSFDVPRHSYFCYFYQPGNGKISNLNICRTGHHAD